MTFPFKVGRRNPLICLHFSLNILILFEERHTYLWSNASNTDSQYKFKAISYQRDETVWCRMRLFQFDSCAHLVMHRGLFSHWDSTAISPSYLSMKFQCSRTIRNWLIQYSPKKKKTLAKHFDVSAFRYFMIYTLLFINNLSLYMINYPSRTDSYHVPLFNLIL